MYYRNNVCGSLALLPSMAAEGVCRLVFSSICAIYGTPESNPTYKNIPQRSINPYRPSKLIVEQILKDCARGGELSAIFLRYFNATVADADVETGGAHEPETHVVPLALGPAHGSAPPLTVFGDDHAVPDRARIRDYTHATDLADGHVKALEHASRNQGFSAFNLGTGTGISIKELSLAAQGVTGRKVPFSLGPRRAGDPAVVVADPSLAGEVLRRSAQHSNLDNILQTAWNWMEHR